MIDKETKLIDQWSVDDNVPEHCKSIFGTECEVSVRFTDRLKQIKKPDPYFAKYKAKWRRLVNQTGIKADNIFHALGTGSYRKLFKQIDPDRIIAVRLIELLQASKRGSVMEAFYYAGIPIAFWMRSGAENLGQGTLQEIYQNCTCWSQLPGAVREKRSEAWEEEDETHIGNHLSLLWDDPNLVPPKHLLQLPES